MRFTNLFGLLLHWVDETDFFQYLKIFDGPGRAGWAVFGGDCIADFLGVAFAVGEFEDFVGIFFAAAPETLVVEEFWICRFGVYWQASFQYSQRKDRLE